MNLNGSTYVTSLASDQASGYNQVTPGTYEVSVSQVTGGTCPSSVTLTAGPSQAVGFGTNEAYSVLAYVRDGVVYSATITDNLGTPAPGYLTLDVANLSADSGALDVYVLPSGNSTAVPPIASQTPTLGQASFQTVQGLSSPITLPCAPATCTANTNTLTPSATGSGLASNCYYDIWVTGAGNVNDVRFKWLGVDLSPVVNGTTNAGVTPTVANPLFNGTEYVATLALSSTTSGALVDGTLIGGQGGTVLYQASGFVRVRMVSALPPASALTINASVQCPAACSASSASTSMSLPGVTLPQQPPPYTLVPANSSFLSFASTTAGGTTTPIAVPTIPNPLNPSLTLAGFPSGYDFTILVYSQGGTPTATILVDDNLAIPNSASVRVINAAINSGAAGTTGYGAAGYGTGATLTINNQAPVAYQVGFGTDLSNSNLSGLFTTAYGAVTPTSTWSWLLAGQELVAGTPTTVTLTGTPASPLVTGSVYTFLVYDPTNPSVAFFQDR